MLLVTSVVGGGVRSVVLAHAFVGGGVSLGNHSIPAEGGDYDVIVIGAGAAGLSAAALLERTIELVG